ncbi:hypothetical protein [Pseudomonas sp. NBRC 111124]|uniref:hypothetical protein n=1 Tax=Pseudomonas sp. NBRC 111124 TaxID=1661039 RepID=UPI0012E0E40F|nr:hypothetical protein [Pseudomonas sp. NBRC 111124]
MFINELKWRPLSQAERQKLDLLLEEARQSRKRSSEVRWWAYRARIIELLLDNPAERGEDTDVSNLVVFLAKSLSTADVKDFGPEERIAGRRKMDACRGLPGVAVEAFVLFQSNVATSPRYSPFDGRCLAPDRRRPV